MNGSRGTTMTASWSLAVRKWWSLPSIWRVCGWVKEVSLFVSNTNGRRRFDHSFVEIHMYLKQLPKGQRSNFGQCKAVTVDWLWNVCILGNVVGIKGANSASETVGWPVTNEFVPCWITFCRFPLLSLHWWSCICWSCQELVEQRCNRERPYAKWHACAVQVCALPQRKDCWWSIAWPWDWQQSSAGSLHPLQRFKMRCMATFSLCFKETCCIIKNKWLDGETGERKSQRSCRGIITALLTWHSAIQYVMAGT